MTWSRSITFRREVINDSRSEIRTCHESFPGFVSVDVLDASVDVLDAMHSRVPAQSVSFAP